MRHHTPLLILSVTLLLNACSDRGGDRSAVPIPIPRLPGSQTGASELTACDHTKAAWAVGQHADGDVLDRARVDAGAEVARFLRPGQAVTMEFRARRLNLDVDARNTVTAARCG